MENFIPISEFIQKATEELKEKGIPDQGGMKDLDEDEAQMIANYFGNIFLGIWCDFFPIKQFLFIEDGSIKQEDIVEIRGRSPETKVVAYRQGSAIPVLLKNLCL